MIYNTHYDVYSAIMIAIMFIANVSMPFKDQKLRRLYMEMLAVVFLSCILDFCSGTMLSYPKTDTTYNVILYIVTFLYFIIHTLAPFLFCYYLGICILGSDITKKHVLIMAGPAVICELIILVNPFLGWVFTINDGVYNRGPVIWVNYASLVIYYIAIIVSYIANKKKLATSVKNVLLIYLLIAMSTVIIQIFVPTILLECAGMTSVLLIIFFAIQSKDMVEEVVKKESEIARLANEANKTKTEFLSNVSHEIRTPINTMLGMNQMIYCDSSEQKIKEYSKNIDMAGHNLLSMINEILDFSKLESGRLSINPDTYSVENLVREMLSDVEYGCVSKNLELHINVNQNIPKKLYGDSVKIRQCANTLLGNAVNYTDTGYISLDVDYERIDEREIKIKITVKDTGRGIDADSLEKLKRYFETAEELPGEGMDAKGLGFNISKKLLGLMNSHINITSTEGVGTELNFELVQTIVDNTPVGKIKLGINDTKNDLGRFVAPDVKALVVDDNEMNLIVMRGLLKNANLKVVTVNSGAECLQASRKIAFDIIFMDHMMPEMDGVETMKRLKSDEFGLCRNTPIVVVTANAIPKARDEYIEHGFDEYIAKPVIYEGLVDVMINLLPQDKIKFVQD